ncbi:hypothetical protein BH23ACT4_BH23ACT4_09710 [soil metagenome]
MVSRVWPGTFREDVNGETHGRIARNRETVTPEAILVAYAQKCTMDTGSTATSSGGSSAGVSAVAASGVLSVAAGLFWGLEGDFPPLVVTVDWLVVVAVGCLALLVSTFRVQNRFVLGVATLAALFALARSLAWLFADGPATSLHSLDQEFHPTRRLPRHTRQRLPRHTRHQTSPISVAPSALA